MNCKAYRAEIEEVELGRPLSENVRAHVESCPDCRSFSGEQAALRRMIGSLEVVAAPADFDFRLRARLASLKSEGRARQGWHGFAPGALSLALAVSFVLLITVGLIFRQAWRSPSNAPLSQQVAVNGSPASPAVNVAPPISPSSDKPDAVVPPVAAPSNLLAIRPRTSKRKLEELPVAIAAASAKETITSSDSDLIAAEPTRTPPGITTQANALMAVPVEATMKSTRVMLSDRHARMQSVSLRPVSFGAQDVLEQRSGQKELVSAAQSIW